MIELLDDMIGSVLAALDRSDKCHGTLILFTSDHHEVLGDHMARATTGRLLKGCRFFEGLVKVANPCSHRRATSRRRRDRFPRRAGRYRPNLLEVTGIESPTVMHPLLLR